MHIDTDILLIDSYGETSKFYNISKCVLLGKSLIKSPTNGSGQNPIEPSRLGCKIFHGPNVSNFAEIYEYLKSLGVAEQVSSPEELIQSLDEEFKEDKANNNQVIEKIDNYGLNILNNVIKEIKIYINT
jgi:3-deoxy-D-manno-octulosonic-acid transferase